MGLPKRYKCTPFSCLKQEGSDSFKHVQIGVLEKREARAKEEIEAKYLLSCHCQYLRPKERKD
jgi:hypothetical protein